MTQTGEKPVSRGERETHRSELRHARAGSRPARSIDGKTLRSFRDADRSAFIHMVSAWAAGTRMVLGQVKTEDKSNEITARTGGLRWGCATSRYRSAPSQIPQDLDQTASHRRGAFGRESRLQRASNDVLSGRRYALFQHRCGRASYPIVCSIEKIHELAPTPLLSTHDKATLAKCRNLYEDELLAYFRQILPPDVRATVLADRGFGDQAMSKALLGAQIDFVIRFPAAFT